MNQQAEGEEGQKLVPISSNSKSSGHHKNSNKKFAFGKHMFVSFLPFLLLRSLISDSDVLGGETVFLFSHSKSHSEIV